MVISKLIVLILVALTVAPCVVFICMKWGTVGFYRGKEVSGKQNEDNEVQNKNEESEH